MVTLSFVVFMAFTIAFHSARSATGADRLSSLKTTDEKLWDSSISGASYRQGRVMFSITQSRLTLQNIDILSKMAGSICLSHLKTMISGLIPIPCSSLTECWVGFDLCSSEPLRNGTSVTWIKRLFSCPTSIAICLTASKNGCDSISPIVPPISVMTMSASVCLPTL